MHGRAARDAPGGERARRGPRAGHRPPRREAAEPGPPRGRHGEGGGLRPGGRGPDLRRSRRHAALHGAGDLRDRRGHDEERRLQPRHHALPPADRTTSVRRRGRPVDPEEPHAGRSPSEVKRPGLPREVADLVRALTLREPRGPSLGRAGRGGIDGFGGEAMQEKATLRRRRHRMRLRASRPAAAQHGPSVAILGALAIVALLFLLMSKKRSAPARTPGDRTLVVNAPADPTSSPSPVPTAPAIDPRGSPPRRPSTSPSNGRRRPCDPRGRRGLGAEALEGPGRRREGARGVPRHGEQALRDRICDRGGPASPG